MGEDVHLSLLDRVRIPSPCPVPWESLVGDDVRRYCGQCELHVHNLSSMSRVEAEAFLRAYRGEDHVCATFVRPNGGLTE